jgi:L-lactate dehydrogenase complex protein LldG
MNDDVAELIFDREFKITGGQFVFCSDMLEFAEGLLNLAQSKKWDHLVCVDDKLNSFLNQCEFPVITDINAVAKSQAAITSCECLVARTGSILVSSAQESGRSIPVYTPAHVVVAYTSQFVDDIRDALQLMKLKYGDQQPSSVTFITGPSCTADIGNEKVIGAQGPGELYLFLVDNTTK